MRIVQEFPRSISTREARLRFGFKTGIVHVGQVPISYWRGKKCGLRRHTAQICEQGRHAYLPAVLVVVLVYTI
jgi:hypothetical protein